MKAPEKTLRVKIVRELALSILKTSGSWNREGSINLLEARWDSLEIAHRTQFQPLPSETVGMGYMRALLKAKANLPYGLDIWYRKTKVMNIEGGNGDEFQIVSYRPGEWESQIRQWPLT
jgi:hypothetical protein